MADKRLIGHAIRDEHTLALNELEELYIDQFDLRKLLIYYIDGVDASALPALAYQFNVLDPEWNLVTTEQQKRDLIKSALDLHRYRGTPWAIRNVFDMLGIYAELSEWFEFGELPGRYMIKLKTPVPKQTSDLLFALIKKYKRKSSKQITHYVNDPYPVKLASAVRNDRVIEYPVQEMPAFTFSTSILFPMSGMLLPLDTDIYFTGTSTLPSIHIYINGVFKGTATVVDGIWSVVIRLDSADYNFDDSLLINAGFYSLTASVTCAAAIDPINIECTNIADEDTIMRLLPFDIEGTADNTDYVHAYLTEYGVSPQSVDWDPHYVRYIGTAPVVAGEWSLDSVMLPNDLISGRFRLTFTSGAYSSMVEPSIGTSSLSISQPSATVPKYSAFTVSGFTNLPARYEGLALKAYASVFVDGEVGLQRYEIGNGAVDADGEYSFSGQLPGVTIITDECLVEVEYSLVYRAEKEVTIVDGTLSIGTYPATVVPDTDMTIAGTSTDLAGATVTILAKKSTAGDETYASIGTAVIQPDGTWTKANAQLPSATYATGDTANIKAVVGTVQSAVVSVGVESGTTEFTSIESTMEFGSTASTEGGEFESIESTMEFGNTAAMENNEFTSIKSTLEIEDT